MRRLLPWILLLAALPLVAWLVLRKPPGKPPPSAAPPPPDSAEIEAPASSPTLKKWEPEPTALPGEPVTVELMEPPADRYAAAPKTEGDGAFAAIVAKLGRNDVVYDAALGRAAREL